MRPIKSTFLFLLLFFLLATACKKPKPIPPAPPPKECTNSFIAFKKFDTDSFQLIAIDTATAAITSTYNFSCVIYGSGTFIPEQRLYYIFQQDQGKKMHLVYFDLDKNETHVLKYSGALDYLAQPYNFQLLYSKKYNKFYYSYSDFPKHVHKVFELNITDTGYTDREITWASIDGIYNFFMNNLTGEVCVFSFDYYDAYDPSTGKVRRIPLSGTSGGLYNIVFNPNDTIFYSISGRSHADSVNFCMMNPTTGEITKIKTLDFVVDGYTHGTFDVCKNQYILQLSDQRSDTFTSIIWIDVKTGKRVKEARSNDFYVLLTSTEK